MKTNKKKTLLKGEGIHQHTLYGEFVTDDASEFSQIGVMKDSVLRHETPTGEFAEHKALAIDKGKWVMGKQVEYNPFDNRLSRIWD